jgi:hypothetical protein
MTQTDTARYAIPRDTIESSRQRARHLRSRVVFYLLKRAIRRLNATRPQPAHTARRPVLQPA